MLRDRVKDVGLDERFGQTRRERRVFELGPIHQIVDGEQAVQIDRTRHLIEVRAGEPKMLEQIGRELLWTIVRGLEAHRDAITALEELAFERCHQVVDVLVVDEKIAVARDAELVAAVDLHAGEQLIDERVNDRRQEHEVRLAGALQRRRQRDQPRQRARRLHDRAAARPAESIPAVQADDEIQALVQNARKRPSGIERRGAQERHDFSAEVLLEPNA